MFTVRETTAADLKNMQALWADGSVMNFVGFPQGFQQSDAEMRTWYQWINDNRPLINSFVIFENGIFCGESFYRINEQQQRHAALDIKLFPHARGRGIASRALAYTIKAAFKHGATAVWVDPHPLNTKAIALYQRLGFRQKALPEHLLSQPLPPDITSRDSWQLYFELTEAEFKEETFT